MSGATPHRLVVTATAERSLSRLPEAVAAAVVEFMVGPLVEAPRRVGHPFVREPAGLWSAGVVRIASSTRLLTISAKSRCFGSIIGLTSTARVENHGPQRSAGELTSCRRRPGPSLAHC